MKRMPLSSGILLFTAAIIWGFAFVAQSEGMDHLGPFSFIGGRCLMGSAVLLPLVLVRRKVAAGREAERISKSGKDLLRGGIYCGLALCAASIFQQWGIMRTTVGKAGFITTLYVIMVPILGVFLKKKVPRIVWLGAVMAAAGMYLLCVNEEFRLGSGDGLLFVCAAIFSIHIMLIDHFSAKVDGVEISCLQFLVAGIIGSILGIVLEAPRWGDFTAGIIPLAYAGVLSCGVAYTFQIVGQRDADPTMASLIFSLESVFSVLAGWLLLKQRLSGRELLGCAVVFAAVIIVQIPWQGRSRGRSR